MLFFTKVYSNGRLKVFRNSFLLKRFLTSVNDKTEDNSANSDISDNIASTLNALKKNRQKFLIPPLASDKLKEINEVTGITMKFGVVSWAKISTQPLTVSEWKFKTYPEDFENFEEPSLLKFACTLKDTIPNSDLYVMEKTLYRSKYNVCNEVRLTSMLTVLLNECHNGAQENNKLVFLSQKVMNKLHNLIIGCDRVSSRSVLEKKLAEINSEEKSFSENNYSLGNINLKNLKFYDTSSLQQQECLSFVLLLTLSFIDIFIYDDVASMKKIQMQRTGSKI